MRRVLQIVLSICCLVLFACPGFATSFTEVGSAGNLPSTANIITGSGPLDDIFGNLFELTEVDMFQIMIDNFSNFSATTLEGIGLVDDPQLFLFDSAGLAVYMNDEGIGSQSQLPSGDSLGPQTTGLFYLAIGWWDNEPFSVSGRMFLDGAGTNGPGVGGLSPVTDWNGDVIGRLDLPTAYDIHLTGASFAAVPEPSTLVLLTAGLAVLLGFKRRRG